MIRIAIVEDEDSYADELAGYLQHFQKESGVRLHITRYRDGDEIAENYPGGFDILLMDIQMRFMDGMTAAEKIRALDRDVVIMFITNRTDYAIRGYEVDALDYVLKPVSYFSLARKMERALERIGSRSGSVLSIPTRSGMINLRTQELLYVESLGHNLVYHTAENAFSVRGRLQDVEDKLTGSGFFRINKGCLVNLGHVDAVRDGCAAAGGELLPVSRARRSDFMKALTDYISNL